MPNDIEALKARLLAGEFYGLDENYKPINVLGSKAATALDQQSARIQELEGALREAREIVDTVAGENRPAYEWANRVLRKIDAALNGGDGK